MKKTIITLLSCIVAINLNAAFIDFEKETNKIVEAILKNPKVDKTVKEVEAQYKKIIDDYNKLNSELNTTIEQYKSIEQKLDKRKKQLERTIWGICIAVLLFCVIIPLTAGFLLYRRIKKTELFRVVENVSQIKEELIKLNNNYAQLKAKL